MTASSSYGKKSMLYRHSKHIQGGIIVINSYGATRDKKKKEDIKELVNLTYFKSIVGSLRVYLIM